METNSQGKELHGTLIEVVCYRIRYWGAQVINPKEGRRLHPCWQNLRRYSPCTNNKRWSRTCRYSSAVLFPKAVRKTTSIRKLTTGLNTRKVQEKLSRATKVIVSALRMPSLKSRLMTSYRAWNTCGLIVLPEVMEGETLRSPTHIRGKVLVDVRKIAGVATKVR